MKGEELKRRVKGMVTLSKEMDVGWANLYTRLGNRAVNKEGSLVGGVVGNQRTFCTLPRSEVKEYWKEAINDMASDEPGAHMGEFYYRMKLEGSGTNKAIAMFFPKDNPGYKDLTKSAQALIVRWVQGEWYESSIEGQKAINIEEEYDLG